jgi:dolichyl-phosphate beta-glucosyltransferase
MRSTKTTLLVSVLVGGALLYAVFRQIDLELTFRAIREANRARMPLALAMMGAAYALRAGRWLIWDRSLSFWDSTTAVLVGFMGNNVLPARLGGLLRADWIASRRHAQLGCTAAMASIGAERILDGAVLSFFAAVGLTMIEVGRASLVSLRVVSGLFGILACGLAFSVLREASVRRLVQRLNTFLPGHFTRIVTDKIMCALDGIVRLRGRLRLTGAVAATVGIWLFELAFYYIVAAAIFPISLAAAVVLLAVVNFASLFPLTVGGIGAIESAATAFLISIGVPPDRALGIVLTQHACLFLLTTALGSVAYLTGGRTVLKDGQSDPGTAAQNDDIVDRTRSTLQVLKAHIALEAPADRPGVLLSIVIPAYNEQQRLPRTALEAIRWCNLNNLQYEILIVDDGSTDDTLAIVDLLEHHDCNVRHLACPHKGKGAAVRMGMLNTKGRFALFMDADGATPLTEIPRLLMQLEHGHDVAIGSRVLQRAGEVTVETSWHRKVIGRVFARLVNIFAIGGIADTQCGFKMFRQEVVKTIFSRQRLDGFAFDVELLFIARQLGLSIAEIPVNWQNQAGSKVNLLTDSARMLWDLSRIRWMHRGIAAAARGAPDQVGQVRT